MDFTALKKGEGCLNLKLSIMVAYCVSLISNIFLLLILFYTNQGYKWFGIIFLLISIATGVISLKLIFSFTNKSIFRYKSMSRYYTLSLLLTGIFYIIITIYCFASNQEKDLIFFSTFCIIIWIVFHYFFVTIIYNFIGAIGSSKSSNVSANLIDKNDPINS